MILRGQQSSSSEHDLGRIAVDHDHRGVDHFLGCDFRAGKSAGYRGKHVDLKQVLFDPRALPEVLEGRFNGQLDSANPGRLAEPRTELREGARCGWGNKILGSFSCGMRRFSSLGEGSPALDRRRKCATSKQFPGGKRVFLVGLHSGGQPAVQELVRAPGSSRGRGRTAGVSSVLARRGAKGA